MFQSVQAPLDSQAMLNQLLKNIQRAQVDQAHDSAIVLANVKTLRWESHVCYLPPLFNTAMKMELRKSLDSGLLFDQD